MDTYIHTYIQTHRHWGPGDHITHFTAVLNVSPTLSCIWLWSARCCSICVLWVAVYPQRGHAMWPPSLTWQRLMWSLRAAPRWNILWQSGQACWVAAASGSQRGDGVSNLHTCAADAPPPPRETFILKRTNSNGCNFFSPSSLLKMARGVLLVNYDMIILELGL